MAIESFEIIQSNIVGQVNAMAVHSPLVFLVDATYSGTAPDYIFVEILQDGQSLIIVRGLYLVDISDNVRRFKFIADEILRSYMPLFDDFIQTGGSQVEATNLSNVFTIVFRSDLQGTIQEAIQIEAVHAARQIGQTPALVELATNEIDVYYGAPNKPVYVYFYNPEATPVDNTTYAEDYDDEIFSDYDDELFEVPNIV